MTGKHFLSLFLLLGGLCLAAQEKPQPLSDSLYRSLAATPPMGWNSWNKFGCNVSEKLVKEMADAMAASGMADAGYEYIVIDDCWQVDRDADGNIVPDPERFPSGMKALADYIHGLGLKFGLYSCAGSYTCQGRPGSKGHQFQDALQYAKWGVDYLKYDWNPNDEWWMRDMKEALDATGRDIVYSISNSSRVTLGPALLKYAQCWRTTGDIRDTWASLSSIGFEGQDRWAGFTGPGHWPDADMLVLGKVGWGRKMHWTQLTPWEQYTHITLWSILASPMLLGCDMEMLDPFTLSLLCNSEVLDVNQDPLGVKGVVFTKGEDHVIYIKPLEDGSLAVAMFNLGDAEKVIGFTPHKLGLYGEQTVRDLWRQQDVGKVSFKERWEASVPPHGCAFYRLTPGVTGEKLEGLFR